VAVDGAVVGNLVCPGQAPDIVPVDEIFFDGFAFGVIADGAFALVAGKEIVFFESVYFFVQVLPLQSDLVWLRPWPPTGSKRKGG